MNTAVNDTGIRGEYTSGSHTFKTLVLRITLAGETRDVTFFDRFTDQHANYQSKGAHGAWQKRSGQRIWAQGLTVWIQKDGSLKLGLQTTILNRNGYRLIGWADKLVERNPSEHNSAARLPVQS